MRWVVDDRIDATGNGDVRNDLRGRRIDFGNGLIRSIAGKDEARTGIHGDAMHRADVDLCDHFARQRVDDQQSLTPGMRGISAMAQLVNGDVVESAENLNA